MRNTLCIVNRNEPTDARPELFGSVFVLAQHLARLGDAALEPLGITTKQWLLLAVVERRLAGRQPTLSEAATAYGSSRQNVKAIATALEARGYLRLVADPSDRRAVRLAITPKVAVFSEAAWAAREAAVFEAVFEGLPPAEIQQTLEFIHRWLGVVAPDLVVTGDPGPDLTTSQISRSTR